MENHKKKFVSQELVNNLSIYIGKRGYMNEGWNFSAGEFLVIGVGNGYNTLKIEHEEIASSGDYDAEFIIERLN